MLAKYEYTNHARVKMRQYGLSEQRIKRVIRAPFRSEEGVLEKAIAAMQPASIYRDKNGKKTWKQEIWVMYLLAKRGGISNFESLILKQPKIRIITAWRYPGISKKRDAIPEEILNEIRSII